MSTHKHNYPLSKKIAAVVFPFIIKCVMHTIYITCKKEYLLPKKEIPSPSVWVAWHGQIIMVPYVYKKLQPKLAKMHIIVSEHLHGDFAINIYKRYIDFGFIRGSSRKGAIKALISAIEKIKMGDNVGITPDGPKGPVHTISDGAIIVAQKCDVPVIALGWKASRYWQLKSWDEARIPKPFSTITYNISEPIYISKEMDKDEAKNLIRNTLMSFID